MRRGSQLSSEFMRAAKKVWTKARGCKHLLEEDDPSVDRTGTRISISYGGGREWEVVFHYQAFSPNAGAGVGQTQNIERGHGTEVDNRNGSGYSGIADSTSSADQGPDSGKG